MKKFLENNWFPIMIVLLFGAMIGAIIGLSNQTTAKKQACLDRGKVYVTISATGSYCAPIQSLEKI